MADPRVGLIFLVPGIGEELRVRGTAVISTDPQELARHEVKGRLPASVLVVTVERAYFQCARAMKRSRLWDPETHLTCRDADDILGAFEPFVDVLVDDEQPPAEPSTVLEVDGDDVKLLRMGQGPIDEFMDIIEVPVEERKAAGRR